MSTNIQDHWNCYGVNIFKLYYSRYMPSLSVFCGLNQSKFIFNRKKNATFIHEYNPYISIFHILPHDHMVAFLLMHLINMPYHNVYIPSLHSIRTFAPV